MIVNQMLPFKLFENLYRIPIRSKPVTFAYYISITTSNPHWWFFLWFINNFLLLKLRMKKY